MAATIRVQPLPDGVNQRSSWQVTVGRKRESTHTKKAAAKRAARSVATKGDVIVIKRTDGTVQDRYRYQGGGSKSTSKGHVWDVDAVKDDYDDLTNLF